MPERSLAQLIRASRGPVLLITLGFLLALHQATAFSFNQTFPVLIIVFGTMWLLERMVPRPIQVDSFPPPLPYVAPESFHVEREVYGIPPSPPPPPPPQPPPPPPVGGPRL